MMRLIKLGVSVWVAALVLTMIGFWAGTVQATAKADQAVSTSYGDALDSYFQEALKDFQGKAYAGAAAQIRKGVLVLRTAGEQAKGEVEKTLRASADELENMANRLEKEAAFSREEAQKAFSRAHQAMAAYYDSKAAQSLASNAKSDVAGNLGAAADHLEKGWAWLGREKEAGAQAATDYAKELDQKIKGGAAWVSGEVEKGIDAIQAETERLKRASSAASEGSLRIVPIQPPEVVDAGQNVTAAIMRVAKSVIPAIVQVRVTERREVPNPFLPFEGSPFFRRYFGLPKKMPKKFKEELKGLGSGMIVDPGGYILTNNHVVEGATEIEVLLADGEAYSAKVVGTDPKTDLGVVKISAGKTLPCVTFGDSDRVEVGEWVVAIGHPQGLEQTVTQGIISGKHRTGITDPSGYQDFLQTDAPINPGNSGGPLLTLQGQVIGVNSAIATQSGGFEGLGFAIPSQMAVRIANALIVHGKVERGWLGVSTQDVTSDLAKSFGLPAPKGALVADVMKSGPGDAAGLKRGDVVLEYQGQAIRDSAELRNSVAETSIGKDVKLTVWRDKKRMELSVKIGSLEELTARLTALVKERLGVIVGPVTVDQAAGYGMRSPVGVTLHWVDPQGPLGKVGFEKGDLILAIDNHPIDGVDTFVNIVGGLPHHQKLVLVALDHRSGQTSEVQVETP